MGLHVKCPFLQRHNQSVNVNVNAIALFMTRSTLVCFARTAYQAPLLKADLEAERNWNLTKLNFLIRLLANPPTGTEPQLTDRQLNWQLRIWLIVHQECTIHSSSYPPTSECYHQILLWPFCKNAFSHSIISSHSVARPWQGFHLSTLVPRFHGILHWDLINHGFKLKWNVATFWEMIPQN